MIIGKVVNTGDRIISTNRICGGESSHWKRELSYLPAYNEKPFKDTRSIIELATIISGSIESESYR